MDANGNVDYADIVAASHRVQPFVHRTPVLTSTYVNRTTGAEVFFKCENIQKTGSFKFRGATNALSLLTSSSKACGVVAYSSGNHAQAIAHAATLHGVRSVVVMPSDAPTIKINATREYGADIVFYDRHTQRREEVAAHSVSQQDMVLIPPFDHPHIIAAQGTAAMELFHEVANLDYLVVPVGGGGLLGGSAVAAATLAPQCKVIGVEPEAGDDAGQSFRTGRIVEIPVPFTIADGAQTTRIGEHTFPLMRRYVYDMISVSDESLKRTTRLLMERMKLVVEPTGCLAAAALWEGGIQTQGARIGIILSGGNVDLQTLCAKIV